MMSGCQAPPGRPPGPLRQTATVDDAVMLMLLLMLLLVLPLMLILMDVLVSLPLPLPLLILMQPPQELLLMYNE